MAHHRTFPYSNIPWKHQRDLQIPAQEVSNKVGTALSGALDRCGSSAPVVMGPRWSDRFMHSNLKFNFARPRKVHESLTFRNLQMPRWHPRHVSYCSLLCGERRWNAYQLFASSFKMPTVWLGLCRTTPHGNRHESWAYSELTESSQSHPNVMKQGFGLGESVLWTI